MTPVIARLSASLYRCVIGIGVALICGHVIGFRFYGGFLHTAGFVALLIVLGMLLSLVGDVFGTASRNPEAAMQWMLLPQMILGMLSVGFQPAELFPTWIQSFVRNQPISQWVYALRALAGDSTPAAGTVTWKLMAISVAWVVGLALVMGPLSASVREAAVMTVALERARSRRCATGRPEGPREIPLALPQTRCRRAPTCPVVPEPAWRCCSWC